MPGGVTRIVCREDYDDYLDIVANQLAKCDKVLLSDIPPSLKEKAYSAAKRRAQAYLDGDTAGSPTGPFMPSSQGSAPSSQGSGCFIATACYGTPDCHEVRVLRDFRDSILVQSEVGKSFVSLYYRFSPAFAAWLRVHSVCRRVARRILVAPLVRLASYIRTVKNEQEK